METKNITVDKEDLFLLYDSTFFIEHEIYHGINEFKETKDISLLENRLNEMSNLVISLSEKVAKQAGFNIQGETNGN